MVILSKNYFVAFVVLRDEHSFTGLSGRFNLLDRGGYGSEWHILRGYVLTCGIEMVFTGVYKVM